MIDTLKLLVPIADPILLEKLEGTLKRFQKKDLRTGEVEFEFYASNVELGSYSRNVTVRSTQVPTGLFIEFSVAKYERGNNVEMIFPHELPHIVGKLYSELCVLVEYELPHFSNWIVYRLDVCYNWYLADKTEALHAIDFIKRIDYPRKTKFVWDTSVMHKGSAYIIKFYVKSPEFQKHDAKVIAEKDYERAEKLGSHAEHILRFEVGLKRRYLNEYLLKKTVCISDIADDAVIQEMLVHYLGKVFKYVNKKTTTDAEVRRILSEHFSATKVLRLYQFYKGFYYDDEMKEMYLRGGLERSTIYRYKKDLKRVGIGFSLDDSPLGKGILEKLIIPSSDTKFALLDSPATIPV